MEESSKFLIIVIIIAIFSVATINITKTVMPDVNQYIMHINEYSGMKTETFDSTAMSIPITSNFIEKSGSYIDARNNIVIQIIYDIIPKSQRTSYGESFAKKSNATLIKQLHLPDNIITFKGQDNKTIALVTSENKTVMITSENQSLVFKIAKSVKF